MCPTLRKEEEWQLLLLKFLSFERILKNDCLLKLYKARACDEYLRKEKDRIWDFIEWPNSGNVGFLTVLSKLCDE